MFFVKYNENNEIEMATEFEELADGPEWIKTDKEVVRGTDGILYFKGELPEGIEEQTEKEEISWE